MATIKEIYFSKSIPSYLTPELNKKVYFISSDIENFQLIIDNNQNAVGVRLYLKDERISLEMLKKMFDNVIEYDIIKMRNIRSKILSKNIVNNYYTNVYDILKSKGIFYEMGEGLVATGKFFNDILNYVDDLLLKKIKELFVIKEYRYPTLIKTSTLQKCQYFESFPNLLMLVTRLHNDINNYNDFKADYRTNQRIDHSVLEKYCQNVDYCLPPTMCYHTYTQYQDTEFSPNENLVVTTKGKSFRYESKYATSLERLWDFTIREIVFLGNDQFVKESRKKLLQSLTEMIKDLGLNGFIETANDPFFMDETAQDKFIYQKGLQSKYELRLNINEDTTIAAGSFNYHDDFFGTRFDMRFNDNKMPIKTSCAGFGLERFAYAYLCQKFEELTDKFKFKEEVQ